MLACLAARGETAYVIDRLLVGVHQDKELNSAIIKVLPTGTELEVLERDGDFAKVQTGDGTTGWVDASYIMTEKPAQIVVRELEAKHQRATAELETARIEVQMLKGRVAELESAAERPRQDQALLARVKAEADRVEELEGDLERRSARVGALETELQTLEAALADAERQRQSAGQESARALRESGDRAAEEIAALKAKVSTLEAAASTAPRSLEPVPAADAGRVERLEAENRRLAAALESARANPPSPAPAAAPPATGLAHLENLTFLLALGPWQLAVLAFIVLLAFGFGAYSVNVVASRRHGGFRF